MSKRLFFTKIETKIFIFLSCVILIATGIILWQKQRDLIYLTTDNLFSQESLGMTYALYDLGVTDINNDDWLDIFSANHNAKQLFLINNQGTEFSEKADQFGFPENYEAAAQPAPDPLSEVKNQGLYIYWHNYELVIRALKTEQLKGRVKGLVIVPELATEKISGTMTSKSNRTNALSGGTIYARLVNFNSESDGELRIKFPASEPFFQPLVKLGSGLDLSQVYLGTAQKHPDNYEFALPPINSLPYMDRHGMAWTDYDDNGKPDVFIVRGGMSGMMAKLAPETTDEFLFQTESGFENRIEEFGLVKNSCASRQVAWVDFDGDGQLDIYVECGRKLPLNSLQPNQLHQHTPEGKFIEVSAEKNLDLAGVGKFLWLEVDNDLDQDLFWVNETSIFLYLNQSGEFVSQLLGENPGIIQLTVADYDLDGDPDIFAGSRRGSTLFVNDRGSYAKVDPESMGLPIKSFAANWVDYDNDGLVDLHTIPRGIYRQLPNHQFEETGLLKVNIDNFGGYAFSSWFDADNDGFRDLLLGKREPISVQEKRQLEKEDITQLSKVQKSEVLLYRNLGNDNHWLQIQLTGLLGNVPALGAKVKVITADGVQTQQVGQSEGSDLSQGHYRLYFGLGKNQRVDAVEILWSDGKIQTITNPPIDQLLKLTMTP